MDYNQPIPAREAPLIENIAVEESGEPLVCLSDYSHDFLFEPVYYNKGIAGSINAFYVRQQVAQRLLEASRLLPSGYKIKIFDAWRPYKVQLSLYNSFYQDNLRAESTGQSTQEIDKMTRQYVSFPSTDPGRPFLHATGGAVDLTMVKNGQPVDMGTDFDAFTEKAHTGYFELNKTKPDITSNRRLLYNVLNEAGFVNYPFEWWHFDYGDWVWAFYNKCQAIYGGMASCD